MKNMNFTRDFKKSWALGYIENYFKCIDVFVASLESASDSKCGGSVLDSIL
jgi:hypothetical protein